MNREERKQGLYNIAKTLLAFENKDDLLILYPHVRSDGDAYGSAFALQAVMKQLNVPAVVMVEEDLSPDMRFIATLEDFVIWPKLSQDKQDEYREKQKVAIQVDSAEDSRLASRLDLFYAADLQIKIDHHISDLDNSEHIFIDPDAGANVENVYTLILLMQELSGKTLLNHDIALALYTGLLTDTGAFSYNNTSPETLKIASELLEYDLDVATLNNFLFKEKAWRTWKGLAKMLLKAELSDNRRISYLTITKQEMQEYKIGDSVLNMMPAVLRDVKGVLVSLVLRENEDGTIRGNLRSTGDYDISTVAKRHNGGGHKNASGFSIEDTEAKSLQYWAQVLIADINKELDL